MSLKTFLMKIILRRTIEKLNLQEGTVMETKKWFKSKTLWCALVTSILGAVQPMSTALGHPISIPPWVLEVLGGLGLWGLRTGDKPIA